MKKKIYLFIATIIAVFLVVIYFYGFDNASRITQKTDIAPRASREPIVIQINVLVEEMSLNDLIHRADWIGVGELHSVDESRWNTSDGKLPEKITNINFDTRYIIYSDQILTPIQNLKGSWNDPIRIRYFGGQVGQDRMMLSSERALEFQKTYLLFLVRDATWSHPNDIDHFIVLGSSQGIYEISGEKAVSTRDEWLLEDLIVYIEKTLSNDVRTETPLPAELPTVTP